MVQPEGSKVSDRHEVIEGEAVELVEGQESSANLPVPVEPAPTTLFRTDDPQEIVQKAADVANVLARVLRERNLTTNISGREHVRVEGWTLCGTMLGVFPVVEWTRKLDDGWEARVEARTLSGAVVGAAEAECLRSEGKWKSRDDYAIRSMAQTRAMSKALRGPLGFVVSLAGFDPTPEEEMPGSGATGVAATSSASHGAQTTQPGRASAPETLLPESFPAGPDLMNRIGEALKFVEPTVDWRGTWDEAIKACYGKERKDLEQDEFQTALTRLAHVADDLSSGGDFPPPTGAQIMKSFSKFFEGVSVTVQRHEPDEPAPLTGDTPEPDDSIDFGDPDATER